jgi:pyridoxamine 5'-phosphate oxidase
MASEQSSVLPNRDALEQVWENLANEYDGRDVDRPEWWGGYRVVPREIEFWQGRPNRMHDRFRYTPTGTGTWQIDRLSP